MKICLINNLYEPYARGGAERIVKNIADGLKKQNHKVFIITTKPYFGCRRSDVGDRMSEIGYRIYYLKSFYYNLNKIPKFLRLFWHIFDVFDFNSYFKIKKILKKENPDLVITHNLKGIGYLTPLAVKKSRVKYFHTLHDVQLLIPSGLLIKGEEKNWINKNFLVRLYIAINKKLFSCPDLIISPSNWLLDFYAQKGFFQNIKKKIIKNPIPQNFAKQNKNFTQNSNQDFTFLYVGQIETHKGILFLINVFQKLCEQSPSIKYKLIVIGSGSKLKIAEKLAKNNDKIIIKGKIPNSELSVFFSQADILIMPSLCYENSPTVISESFSCGLPVLAANIGGAAELIKENENGYTFITGSKNDLTQKIKFCFNNKNKIYQFKKSALETASALNIDKYIAKLLFEFNKK